LELRSHYLALLNAESGKEMLQPAMKRFSLAVFILGLSTLAFAQEFRSTAAVQSASQPFTVDLSNISNVSGAAITIRNSSSSTVSLPQVFTPGNQPPLNGPAILARLNSLPPPSSDQERVIQAWQFVKDHTYHFCSSGTAKGGTTDPLVILNGFGFGCCDQSALALAWIWQQQGFQAREASFTFHTVPEVFYGNAWHMLDPDHKVYYLKADQTVASVEDILNDPSLVSNTVNSAGTDPAGWSGEEMAALYVEYGATLQYWPTVSPSALSTYSLRPGENMSFISLNKENTVQFYNWGQFQAPSGVNSIHVDWNLTFAYAGWKQLASVVSGVDVTADSSGTKFLANTSTGSGYVVYSESSLFPVLSLRILAQLAPGSEGSLQAYYSADGTHWSNAVPFQPTNGYSSFDLSADLSSLAAGASTYYVKVELDGAVQLHRLRISPVVQAAYVLFPALQAGGQNQLVYQDSSAATQARALKVTTKIPTGMPLIRGVHAVSLVPESPAYSLAQDYAAANLVDGDPDSLAYPGSSHIDYVIQLNATYNVTGVSIDWGYFGSDARYVQSWQILGRSGDQDWQQLASGGFPGQATMDVPLNVTATELRLVASANHYIGVYEVRVFGVAAPSLSTLLAATVQSNVPEDPIYSIARNYGAANLIDGDPKTLVYPGSKNLDYQISLGKLTHLSSANITWGYFGTNSAYVSSWSLLGKNGAGGWTTLAQGGFPNSATTQLNLDFFATDVRILASSNANWIGIYDLSLKGGQPMSGLAVKSNVGETVGCTNYPNSNIDDDDDNTLAYPCNSWVDYTLDPGGSTFVDTVRVVWGYFGSDPRYIQTWRLLGLALDGRTWEVVASGTQPGASETLIPVHNRYRMLRIAAEGSNWIGVYEVHVFGTLLPLAGQATVKSNVSEDPVYSIALGYQASNLIDGNPRTLAYPGSSHIDYQVSLGQLMQLSSASIDWGGFGTNPIYVSNWSLLARSAPGQPWVTLAQGGFPNSPTTLVNLDFAATDVRLVASAANWIGVYELKIDGVPLQ
jgi:hypothetical protein